MSTIPPGITISTAFLAAPLTDLVKGVEAQFVPFTSRFMEELHPAVPLGPLVRLQCKAPSFRIFQTNLRSPFTMDNINVVRQYGSSQILLDLMRHKDLDRGSPLVMPCFCQRAQSGFWVFFTIGHLLAHEHPQNHEDAHVSRFSRA